MIKNDQICWTTAVVQYQSGDEIMGDMLVIYLFFGGKIVHSLSIFMGLLDHSTIFTGWWRTRFPAKRDYENPSKPTNNTGFECSSFWDHPRMNALPELGGQQLQLGSLLKLRKNNHTITNQAWEKDSSVLNFQCLIGDIACFGGTTKHGELIINMFSLDILNTTYVVHRPPINAPFSPSFMEVYPHWRVQTYDKHGDGEMEHTWHYVRTSNLWMELKMITSIHYSDMDEFTGIAHHFVSSGDKWYLYYI